jgi:hypothetical protein
MLVAIGAIQSIKLREQRATVLMLDFPFEAQFAVAITERLCKLRFQSGETIDLLPHIPKLALEHGLHFRTNVMLLPQRQQLFDFGQGEPQFLGMSHKHEITNLLAVEQAISARAATRTLDEFESLIEANRVHADAGEFRGLTDVNDSHHTLKDKPWSYVQSQEDSLRLKAGDIIVFYSPRELMGSGPVLQAFAATGRILDEFPYEAEQSAGFCPYRRRTKFFKSREAPIRPLLQKLTFTQGNASWGLAFRRGAFRITADDFKRIAKAMSIKSEDLS